MQRLGGSILVGKIPWRRSSPLKCSCTESMDGGACGLRSMQICQSHTSLTEHASHTEMCMYDYLAPMGSPVRISRRWLLYCMFICFHASSIYVYIYKKEKATSWKQRNKTISGSSVAEIPAGCAQMLIKDRTESNDGICFHHQLQQFNGSSSDPSRVWDLRPPGCCGRKTSQCQLWTTLVVTNKSALRWPSRSHSGPLCEVLFSLLNISSLFLGGTHLTTCLRGLSVDLTGWEE